MTTENNDETRRGKTIHASFPDKQTMPHFIIECSENITQQKSPEEIMQAVYDVAEATGLFAKNDIKIRLRLYPQHKLGADKRDFIHIFGNIVEGRSTEQRENLSKQIIKRLHEMFPGLSISFAQHVIGQNGYAA